MRLVSASIVVLACHPTLLRAASFLPFLNFTSSAPLIFQSLASLLQVHSQTIFPNGHTIASVTIPRNTLLYHGRHDSDPVPSPEWLAFDIEMAYGIMGNMPDSRMLSYRTVKNVRAVYFDGASANLMGDGTKSQMVFIYNGTDDLPKRGGWGPPPGRGRRGTGHNHGQDEDDPPRRPPGRGPPGGWNPLQDEYFRARELCSWLLQSGLGGRGWGYEGIVRMNAGFELVWCDFDSPSLKLVSNLNVSAPLSGGGIVAQGRPQQRLNFQEPAAIEAQQLLRTTQDEGPHGPGMSDPREPFRNTSNWFWFSAAAKRYSGDSRIKVDVSGIFSFYEPGLSNQTGARIADDIDRLGLSPNGKWKLRHAPESQLLSSVEEWNRSQELDNLKIRRRQHRLITVDKTDGMYMRTEVENRLQNSLRLKPDQVGTDWHYITTDIVSKYGDELRTLLDYLGRVPQPHDMHSSIEDWMYRVRQLSHWFLLPFFEYPPERPYAKKELSKLFSLDSLLAKTTLQRCISQYETDETSEEDAVFGQAVKETLEGLCSVVVKIGLRVEYYWFMYFDPKPESWSLRVVEAYPEIIGQGRRWQEEMEELVAWLGWAGQRVECNKQCSVGETCYIPMWPVNGWGRGRRWGEDSKFLWEPVCVAMEKYPPEQWMLMEGD